MHGLVKRHRVLLFSVKVLIKVHPHVTTILVSVCVIGGIFGQVYSGDRRSLPCNALVLAGCALLVTSAFRISLREGWGAFFRSPLTIVGLAAVVVAQFLP
jgi:hypothetical protein